MQVATQPDIASVELIPDALRRIPRSLARGHDVLPLLARDGRITVAMPDPADENVLERIRRATGLDVEAIPADRDVIRGRVSQAYLFDEVPASDDAPAVRALDEVQAAAIALGCSDIHFEPMREGGRVRHRLDGVLHEARSCAPELFGQLVSRVKILAGMDIAERRLPQDGRYSIDLPGRPVEARVSSMPTISGEKLVVRLLDHYAAVPDLSQLGMRPPHIERFLRAIGSAHGFVIVCGPTGSGKTTTLYAALAARNLRSENVCTVEDPIEVRMPGVAQVQVNIRAGVTFASALRGFLRQDPNVLMVGEMRDEETAAAASSASLSGQLVLTTLHANDSAAAIDRLAELRVSRHTLAAGLSAIVSQRLVRRLCADCKTQIAPAVWAPGTCSACAGRGYRGRIAIFEALFVDRTIRNMIAAGRSGTEILNYARTAGFVSLVDDGRDRAAQGVTSLEEVARVAGSD